MTDRFTTPKIKGTVLFKTPRADCTPMEGSESDDSMTSVQSGLSVKSSNTETSDGSELSVVSELQELLQMYKLQRQADVEDTMIDMVQQMKELRSRLVITQGECQRLQMLVAEGTHSLSDVESKLNLARKMVDAEKRRSKRIQEERDELRGQIQKVKEFLFRDNRGMLNREANEKLPFLNLEADMFDPNLSYTHQLGAIPEVNTTGSLLSDFSYSRSEDDLDTSVCAGRNWKKPRHSAGPEAAPKKRRSSTHQRLVEISNTDNIRATTTLTVPKHGPITATSVIEAVPTQNELGKPQTQAGPTSDIIFDMWQSNAQQETVRGPAPVRQHSLQSKTLVLPDTCGVCERKLRFGKTVMKCKDCRATCHPECQKDLPLPCIPHVNTPTKNLLGLISDFTPTTAPMVPALIVHCVNEIDQRGLLELGIYRIPGSEREVKMLKEKFLRGKGSPNLREVDIHVICGTVKDFLRFLHEPLITYNLWPQFVRCVEGDQENITAGLYRLISELPQPNRDTLAYMMLHLRRVAESPECKMPISNLAKVFGPTIVGYSSGNPSEDRLLIETSQQNMAMEAIMNLSTEYWSSFVNLCETQPTPRLQQTPSTDSLLRPTSRNIFTPHALKSAKRKHRIFNTPPSCRHNY